MNNDPTKVMIDMLEIYDTMDQNEELFTDEQFDSMEVVIETMVGVVMKEKELSGIVEQ